jgi:hypothetical protein
MMTVRSQLVQLILTGGARVIPMFIPANTIPFHLAQFDVADDWWRIVVQDAVRTQSGRDLFITMLLEKNINEETVVSRHLSLMVPHPLIFETETASEVISQIREWVGTTEGDGYLDLVRAGKQLHIVA